MSDQAKNIFQRINAVRRVIGYVQKDKSVSTGGGSYKAVTHDQVTGMIRAALIENGIVILTTCTDSVFHPKEGDSKQRLYVADFDVSFVNEDKPDDRITVHVNSHALDSGDKAPGKAMSYATKYAILKTFAIETGEDEESRYQTEEFDLEAHLLLIKAAGSMDELKKQFAHSLAAAEATKDRNLAKQIITAKDSRKLELAPKQTEGVAA